MAIFSELKIADFPGLCVASQSLSKTLLTIILMFLELESDLILNVSLLLYSACLSYVYYSVFTFLHNRGVVTDVAT